MNWKFFEKIKAENFGREPASFFEDFEWNAPKIFTRKLQFSLHNTTQSIKLESIYNFLSFFLFFPPSFTYRTTEKHNWLSVNPKTKWDENHKIWKYFFVLFSFGCRGIWKRKRKTSNLSLSRKFFTSLEIPCKKLWWKGNLICFPRRKVGRNWRERLESLREREEMSDKISRI